MGRVVGKEPGAQISEIEPLGDIGALVGTGKLLPAPPFPDRALAVGFQLVEAGQPAQEHQKESCRKNRGLDLPLGAGVPDQPPLFSQAEDLFSVSQKPSQDGDPFSFRAEVFFFASSFCQLSWLKASREARAFWKFSAHRRT